MNWKTKNEGNAKPLVADEDIRVIKFLYICGDRYISPFQNFIYDLDMPTPKINLICTRASDTDYDIGEGYHSYERGDVHIMPHWDGSTEMMITYGRRSKKVMINYGGYPCRPFECIIPKGSIYYANEEHEIVSETIIVKELAEYRFGFTKIKAIH